ncbi:MAG TPA: hypothetical protein VGG85_04620 [Terracidiphilus sp.]|jgi:hypothetical protein
MRKFTTLCCLLLLIPAFALRAHAQETAKPAETAKDPEPSGHYYHLEFVIQELGTDGKPTNSRTYSAIVSSDRGARSTNIRTGSRIPIITGALHGTTGDGKLEFQYQYLDVGVNIDIQNVREIGSQLAVFLKAEISSLASSAPPASAPVSAPDLPNDPVIRQNLWQAPVVIPVGKPTVVFSSDALESKGGMQVVITATMLH